MPTKKTTKDRSEVEIDPRFLPVVETFAADPLVSGGTMMSSYGLKVNGTSRVRKRSITREVSSGCSNSIRWPPGITMFSAFS